MARRGLRLPKPPPPRRLSFREFVDEVRPGYVWYRHSVAMADVLQRVADGELRRVMFFCPPRHGKTELASKLFPAYWLYLYPQTWCGLASYGATLAKGNSRAARDNFTRGGGKIRDDSAAVEHWATPEGGGVWAAGVGGGILGKGWNLGVIDDPTKDAVEAFSDRTTETLREWFDSTFMTREEPHPLGGPDGAMVIVQQRWSENDLPGWLLSREEQNAAEGEKPERWHVVNFEAIKEEEPMRLPETCTLEPDWREVGEALWPERRPIEKLLKIKRANAFYFAAMFQQRPIPRDGAMFPPGKFKFVDASPARFEAAVRYWDKAGAKPGKGDWTVGVLMARCADGLYWILDVHRGQWPPDERNAEMVAVAELDRQRKIGVRTWIEQPPGDGVEATQAIVRALAGYPVDVHPAKGKKEENAEGLSSQVRAGNVRVLIDPRWNRPYMRVMTAFPYGNHDDDVDASSGAFNKLTRARAFRVR